MNFEDFSRSIGFQPGTWLYQTSEPELRQRYQLFQSNPGIFKESQDKIANANNTYGQGNYTATPVGILPKDGAGPQAAPSTSPFVVGGVPTGTQSMAAYQQTQPMRQQSMPNPYAQPQQPLMPQTQMQHQAMQPTAGQALPSYANSNPYLQGAMNSIQSQVTQNLQRNVLPQLGRNSVATGGYGGSRQGIAEGLAMGDAATAATNAMGNLAFQGFNADRNFGLANDAMDLNVYNANQNWMNQGAQNQLSALNTILGWNQNYGIGNATNVQNTPMNYWQQFSQGAQGLGGMGGTGTQNLQGNPWLGALGGYQLGSSLWRG